MGRGNAHEVRTSTLLTVVGKRRVEALRRGRLRRRLGGQMRNSPARSSRSKRTSPLAALALAGCLQAIQHAASLHVRHGRPHPRSRPGAARASAIRAPLAHNGRRAATRRVRPSPCMIMMAWQNMTWHDMTMAMTTTVTSAVGGGASSFFWQRQRA